MAATPRTNYQQLADNAHFVPQPRRDWSLQSKDPHTRREMNRLAAEAFRSLITEELSKIPRQ